MLILFDSPIRHAAACQTRSYRHYYDEIAEACYNRRFSAEDASAIGSSCPEQWLGLITETGHPAASGMLMFFRWFALAHMSLAGLHREYSHVIITRSDYLFVGDHPPVIQLTPGQVYV